MQAVRMNRRTLCQAAGLAVAAGMPAARAAAQEATPAGATPAAQPASGGIASMLAMAPASFPWADNPAQVMISYADLATQLAVTQTPPADSMDDPGISQWIAATRPLAMASTAVQYLAFWREDYGFDLFQADETLELSLPPFNLALFRGSFDHDAVRTTLTGKGYQPVDVDGHEILTLRDDYEQDVTAPFAYKLAAMNHVALMDDGTIACSSVQAALVAAFDVANGTAPSLMEQAGIAQMVEEAPAELVSGVTVSGTSLTGNIPPELIDLDGQATPDIGAIATRVAADSEMPPVVQVLLGSTAGGPLFGQDVETPAGVPDAHAVAVLLMLSPEGAEMAVPVIEERLATGESIQRREPWTDLFPDSTITAVDGAPVVVVDLTLGPETHPVILIQMLMNRDLGFLAW